ncbi:MAG: VPLPA-CTERM sorting domain-containing protein [Pseudomonadota bacterium]
MNKNAVIVWACVGLASLTGAAHAATIDINYDLDLAYTSEHGIRSHTRTWAGDHVGAQLFATYADGTTEQWEWIQLYEHNPYVTGTDHISENLTIEHITRGYVMDITKRLASFVIDLTGAGIVWDAGGYEDPDPRNSPGTLGGREFFIKEGNGDSLGGEIVATYSDRVQLGDHTTGEDTFTRLLIDFSGLDDGGFVGDLIWNADTDGLAYTDDLTPVMAPVPLPAGGLLLLTAFGAFVTFRRKGGQLLSA